MRINQWLVMAGVAAGMCLGASQSWAQPSDRGGRPDFRNMDSAQMQEFFMNVVKERLEIKDDTEWKALQPLVQKVMDLRRQVGSDRMRSMFSRRGGDQGGDQGSRRFGSTPSPEAEALQRAIDSKASNSELKAAMAKYAEWRKAKLAELEKAQEDLRKFLTVRQEAIAVSSGWL